MRLLRWLNFNAELISTKYFQALIKKTTQAILELPNPLPNIINQSIHIDVKIIKHYSATRFDNNYPRRTASPVIHHSLRAVITIRIAGVVTHGYW